MTSFEARFRKAEIGDVDYSTIPEKKLKMPVSTDSLRIVAEKLRDLAQAVKEGKSIAVATEFKGARYQERDPVKLASVSFTPQENEQYSAWRTGGCCGEYGTACQHDEHSVAAKTSHVHWLFNNWSCMLPLATAFALVEKAKKNLVDGSEYATADEIAEIQTIEEAFSETRQVLGRAKTLHRSTVVTRDIAYSQMALANRAFAIMRKIAKYIPRDSTLSQRCVEFTKSKPCFYPRRSRV